MLSIVKLFVRLDIIVFRHWYHYDYYNYYSRLLNQRRNVERRGE